MHSNGHSHPVAPASPRTYMNQPSFPRGVGSDIRQWATRHRGGTAGTRRSSSAGCQPVWIEIIASDEHKINQGNNSCKLQNTPHTTGGQLCQQPRAGERQTVLLATMVGSDVARAPCLTLSNPISAWRTKLWELVAVRAAHLAASRLLQQDTELARLGSALGLLTVLSIAAVRGRQQKRW